MQYSVATAFCFLAAAQALESVTVKTLTVEEADAANYTWTVTNWAATCASANSSCSYSEFHCFRRISCVGNVLLNMRHKASTSVLQNNLQLRRRLPRSVTALA